MSWDNTIDMADDVERAKQYRGRAAELRAVTKWMKDPNALSQVTAMAIEYERMAANLEKLTGGSKRESSEDGSDAPDA